MDTIDEPKYNNFVKGSKQGINEIGTDKENFIKCLATDAGVLAQWLDGDVDENGNYINPKRLEGSRTVLNPFGMEVKDLYHLMILVQ